MYILSIWCDECYGLISGCWLSTLTDCENSQCSYESSTSEEVGNQKINFCCCHGSKCNELDSGSKGKKGSKGNRDRKVATETSRSVAKVEKTTVYDTDGEH